MKSLYHWFADDTSAHQASDLTLRILLTVSTLVVLALTFAGVRSGLSWPHLSASLLWIPLGGAAELARRSALPRLSAAFLVLGMWSISVLSSWLNGGLSAPIVSAPLVLIPVAGLLSGFRFAILLCFFSLAHVSSLYWAHLIGLIDPNAAFQLGDYAYRQWFNLLGSYVIAALVAFFAGRGFSQSLKASRAGHAHFERIFTESPLPMALTRRSESPEFADPLWNQEILLRNAAWHTFFRLVDLPSCSESCSSACRRSFLGETLPVKAFEWLSAHGSLDREPVSYASRENPTDPTRRLHCKVSARQIEWDGQPAWLWTFENVTDYEQLRSRMQAQIESESRALAAAEVELAKSERLAALGALVAGIAHEINTPIGNALLASSHALDQARDLRLMIQGPVSRSKLEKLSSSLLEATELVELSLRRASDSIGGFKQMAADQTSMSRRDFILHETLSHTLRSLEPTLRQHHLHVSLDLGPTADFHLDSRPGALAQILTILLTNCALHAFEGFPDDYRRELRIHAEPVSPDSIRLVFSDNGRGIPLEAHERVFQPFFTTASDRGGTGLGLPIARDVAKRLLGGQLSLLTSESATGATFDLLIPLRLSDQASEPPSLDPHSFYPTSHSSSLAPPSPSSEGSL